MENTEPRLGWDKPDAQDMPFKEALTLRDVQVQGRHLRLRASLNGVLGASPSLTLILALGLVTISRLFLDTSMIPTF